MTIASEITRLQTAKTNIRNSIQQKGVAVPSSAKLDTYSSYVDAISVGADIKGLFKQVTPTSTIWSMGITGSPADQATRKTTFTYNDSNYWVFFYLCEPWSYNANCTYGDRYATINSFIWIIDKNNNYNVTKISGGYKGVYYGRGSDKNYWGSDCFWGYPYFYKKGNQLKFQSYKDYEGSNYTYGYSMVAYGLYDLTVDLSSKTVTNSEIYSQTRTGSYSEHVPDLPTEFEYTNLEQHPDNTWTLLGNPSGNNMNKGYSGYSVAPSFSGERSGTCGWSGTISLVFTAT